MVASGRDALLRSWQPFVMCFVLVRPLKVSALRDSVIAAPATRDRTFDEALLDVKAWISPSIGDARNEDEDDDVSIVSSTAIVSLRDPISLARITVPARGKNCRHVACFDLDTILEFTGSRAGAGIKCPICRRINMLPELYVDLFMHKLLQEVPESVMSVEIDAQGQWHVPTPQLMSSTLNLDVDLDVDSSVRAMTVAHTQPGACAAQVTAPRPYCAHVDLSHVENDVGDAADVDRAHARVQLGAQPLSDLYSPASIGFVERILMATSSAGRSAVSGSYTASDSRRRSRAAVRGLSDDDLSDEVESHTSQRRQHVTIGPFKASR